MIVTISTVTALFVGFVIGSAHSTSSWVQWNNQNVSRGYASNSSTYVMALTCLRKGDEKGCVNILENSLETSLFALNKDCKTLAKNPDAAIYQTIKEARTYRSKHPWGQDNAHMTAEVEQTITAGVDQVLSLGK